ncbi:MAG: sigma-70 family RNA polymerase sigma factor [Bacteroidota bacterium]
MTDQHIIEHLQSGEATREDLACQHLYQQYFGLVESLVVKNKVEKTITQDVFQDTIVALWKVANRPKFILTSTIKTLLYAIAQNQLRDRLKKQGREIALTSVNEAAIPLTETALEPIVQSEQTQLIQRLIQNLGTDCQKVLHLFYFQKWSMKKIQAAFEDKSTAVTKNRKARCLQRLRTKVLGNAELIAELT